MVQNQRGTYYAITFFDDGLYRLRTFGTESRSHEEIEANELDINKELGIDNHTMPIPNFSNPFITCTFIDDDLIFVGLFHSASLTHRHFIFNHKSRNISN